jgi:hypothetical protein
MTEQIAVEQPAIAAICQCDDCSAETHRQDSCDKAAERNRAIT